MEPLTLPPAPGSVLTRRATEFIDEWLSDRPYVEAHTSGTTGAPKAIRLLKTDMMASATATNRFFGIDSSSLLLLPLSADYIAGKMQLVRAMAAGCAIVCEEPSNRPFASGVERRVKMLPVVPSQVGYVIESGLYMSVDNIIIGGAPLGRDQEKMLLESGVAAYATYGMTETCSHVALRKLGSHVYMPLPGFVFSQDERGCLVVSTDRMSFGRLSTNDVVRLRKDGGFDWLGRYDNVINSGGIKIHPEEIERLLMPLIPSGFHLYVASRPSEKWGEEAVLVTDFEQFNPDCLKTLGLEPYKMPKAVYVRHIRLTSSGKVIREKLRP